MPFMVGSTTVSVIAADNTASIALPPRANMAAPAWDASGCEVDTTLRASTGWRAEANGRSQFIVVVVVIEVVSLRNPPCAAIR